MIDTYFFFVLNKTRYLMTMTGFLMQISHWISSQHERNLAKMDDEDVCEN